MVFFFSVCGHVQTNGASEMTQWVKAPATTLDNLSGIARTHMVKDRIARTYMVKDRSESYELSSDLLHTCHSPCNLEIES